MLLSAIAALGSALSPSLAEAQTEERWLLHTELAFTTPVGEPEVDRFGPGGSAAVGVFHSLHPAFLLGVQGRASVFSDNRPPADPLLEDEGIGGLYTASIAARVRPFGQEEDPARGTGPFVELSFGAALTEDLARPTMEAGIGWGIAAGPVDLVPTVRYQHVFHEGPLQSEDGNFFLVGLGGTFFDGRTPEEPAEEAAPTPAPRIVPLRSEDDCPMAPEDFDGHRDDDGCPDLDNDHDGIVDRLDDCPDRAETFNGVNDRDGCPDSGLIEVVGDRLVIQEEVFFDYDESDLRPHGREVLREIAALWRRHPEWVGMVIEGHTDSRGSEEYNRGLSRRRADTVRDTLVSSGLSADRIELRPMGERDPQIPGADTELEHQLNRRVEFIVVRATAGTEVSERPSLDAVVEN